MFIIASCDESQEQPVYTAAAVTQFDYAGQRELKNFRKEGHILKLTTNSYEGKRKIILWSSRSAPRDTLYRLEPGEKVIVYGKSGEYIYLSPAKDTSITGFLLSGWVDFIENSNENVEEYTVADLPELGTEVRKTSATSNDQRPQRTSLSNILQKMKRAKSDSIYFDEKHLVEDRHPLKRRVDTVPLFFEQ
jgi:hypothetical protein